MRRSLALKTAWVVVVMATALDMNGCAVDQGSPASEDQSGLNPQPLPPSDPPPEVVAGSGGARKSADESVPPDQSGNFGDVYGPNGGVPTGSADAGADGAK